MAERDLNDMTLDELYEFKDHLTVMRDRIKGRRGPGPTHTRGYCRDMWQRINYILLSRNAPLRRANSHQRVHGPGAAPWQKDADS